MDKQVEVKALILSIGKREVALTIEEAKKLHEALNAIFGEKLVRHEHHHDRWYYPWNTTIISGSSISTATTPPGTDFTITCNNTGLISATL